MGILRVVLVTVLALGAVALPAQAARPTVLTRGADLAQPRVVGGETLYTTQPDRVDAARYHVSVRSVRPAQPPVLLRSVVLDRGHGETCEARPPIASFAASATRFAFESGVAIACEEQGLAVDSSLDWAARPHGAPDSIFVCHQTDYDGASREGYFPFDVEGERIAYLSEPCTGAGTTGVTVSDAGGGTRTFPLAVAQVAQVELAGHFVAWSTAAGVTVGDADTGAILFTAPAAVIALQADGKLATLRQATPGHCPVDLAWYSPAEPTAHPIPVHPCTVAIRMAGDRIAYGDRGARLELTDLAGHVQTAAPLNSAVGDAFDLDGARIAYVGAGCGADTPLASRRLPLTGAAPARPVCRAQLESRSVRRRGRSVLVRLACPTGCAAAVQILRTRSRSSALGERDVTLPRHGRRTVRVPLGPGTTLPRGRRAYVRLAVAQAGRRGEHVLTLRVRVR